MDNDSPDKPAVPMPVALPSVGTPMLPAPMQESLAEIQQQRQQELQRVQQKYEHDQRQIAVAQRQWDNQRERAHMTLMAQVPKLIGAAVAGAVLAYVIPLGVDR